MPTPVSIFQVKPLIERCLEARIVPMLHGSPGVGKSAVMSAVAREYGLKLIDVRLAQCDPTDLNGFPTINNERTLASYVPMSTFPVKGTEVPKGYSGWLLLLDELTSADRSVQKAAYKLILDRMVGEHELHDKLVIAAAGNLLSDSAIVEEMSTALQSRMVHFHVMVTAKEWVDWGAANAVDHRILSYINFKPDHIHLFNPDHQEFTFACPRTWEFANRLIDSRETLNEQDLILLQGTLGDAVANEFYLFSQIYQSLPTIGEIMANPSTVRVPDEPSVLYATIGMAAEYMNKANAEELMQYVNRLPFEYQTLCVRHVNRRHSDAIDNWEAIIKWITVNGDELF